MANKTEKNTNLKSNRSTFFAILAFSVALCFILIFAGNKSEEVNISETDISQVNEESVVEIENIDGYGIYVDGYFVAAALSEDDVNKAINSALNNRVSTLNIENAENSFSNNFEIIFGSYENSAYILNISECLSDKVYNYNGELLPINLSVSSVKTIKEDVIIKHETKIVYTDGILDGAEDVINDGFDGEGIQTYEIVYIDGKEVSKNAVSLEVTSPVVDKVVHIGSRSDGKTTASIGNFIKPYDGFVSSYMGSRWGTTHNGIDICQYGGCFRDPALASCDGVVISATDKGDGYGNCVIVDHGEGVVTLYAHLDEFCVEEGDIVNAGDVVGLIGNTGFSLGPHLHFEVRIDGKPVNPLMFVDYE